jgi:hypothetical protein
MFCLEGAEEAPSHLKKLLDMEGAGKAPTPITMMRMMMMMMGADRDVRSS